MYAGAIKVEGGSIGTLHTLTIAEFVRDGGGGREIGRECGEGVDGRVEAGWRRVPELRHLRVRGAELSCSSNSH